MGEEKQMSSAAKVRWKKEKEERWTLVMLSMLDARAERKEEWVRYDKMFVERMESTDPVTKEEEDPRLAEYIILTRDWNGTNYPHDPS
ncbi:hypothetical protein CAEBREN_25824 [Caenorhabditis brenneri]|uniref:Uncharacterized protein n=1 Tax=Caenorhabditis brenneri TaxID=135651 RepID=G0NI92_CAEBE|nr:hypothetical protein CAEBREN_25824 [Caenorhabditis brenneri]